MNYLSLLWLLIFNKLWSQFKGIFPTACLTLRSSVIAFSCFFQRITGTDYSFDRLDKSKSLNFLFFFVLTGHFLEWQRKVNLQLLEWVFTTRKRRRDYTQSAYTTGANSDLSCGETLSSAQILSQDGANRKADQGFRKWYWSTSWRQRERFFPVGPGKPCFRLKITVPRTVTIQQLFKDGRRKSLSFWSRVEGRGSSVIFITKRRFLFWRYFFFCAGQSSSVYMFLPDLI